MKILGYFIEGFEHPRILASGVGGASGTKPSESSQMTVYNGALEVTGGGNYSSWCGVTLL